MKNPPVTRVFKYRRIPNKKRRIKEANTRVLAMQRYRRKRGKSFELAGNVVLRSLDFIDDMAVEQRMLCILDNKEYTIPCISITTFAKLLSTTYQTVWRWQTQTGQIPQPVFRTNGKGRNYFAYHVDEARVMVAIIGGHLNQYSYYRHDHSGTRDRVFQFIEEERARIIKGAKNGKSTRKNPTEKT